MRPSATPAIRSVAAAVPRFPSSLRGSRGSLGHITLVGMLAAALGCGGKGGDDPPAEAAAPTAPAAPAAPAAPTGPVAATLAMITAPSVAASRRALAPQPVVQAQNASGEAVAAPGLVIRASLTSGGGTLAGTDTAVTASTGAATFSDLAVAGVVGPRVITFSSPGLANVTAAMVLTAGVAAAASVSAGADQAAVAGTAVAVAPAVQVTDADGNAVAGVGVTFAVASGGGAVTGAAQTTNAAGVATVTRWTLGATAGPNTLTATVAGLARPPVTFAASGTSPAAPAFQGVLARSVVLAGLSSPWDIAVAADGSVFFTERCRGLSVRHPDGSVTRLFGTSGSALVAQDLACVGQSGVHGVALDPAFATNRTLYVYMLSTLRTAPRTNRVVRLVLNGGYTSAGDRTDIVTDIAFKDAGNAVGGAGAHSGGRLRFGPDGFLYVTTGDNHDPALPQSPLRLGGKVLRVTAAGDAAPGNAAPAGFDRRIFTYGHRNVQGIAFRPGTGQPFVAEHGPNHSDEVTPLVNGGNGGWDPRDRPTLSCPDGYCGYAGDASTMPMTDVARFPDAMRPSWSNDRRSQGMGPAAFLVGAQWGAWDGRLAVGVMGGSRLVILELDAAGTATSAVDASLPAARYRGLTVGPDGSLYVATDAGEIWRVTPSRASP